MLSDAQEAHMRPTRCGNRVADGEGGGEFASVFRCRGWDSNPYVALRGSGF